MHIHTRFVLIRVIVSATVVLTIVLTGGCARTSAPSSSTPTSTPAVAGDDEATNIPTVLLPASPTSPPPLLYAVQEGDTLGAIAQTYGVSVEDLIAANDLADPNVLSVGQTLVIPVAGLHIPTSAPPLDLSPAPSPTAAQPPTPLPTLTPSGPPLVEIGQVLGSGDVAAEVVVVRNRGGVVSLEKWTLSDVEGNIFTFPPLILFTDVDVRLHSTVGASTPKDLYWGRANPAWNGGELITLRDAAGEVVDTYIVP